MTAHPCPDCRCWTPDDDQPVQPATSSEWARRQAREAAAAAVKAAKDKRKKPTSTCRRCGETSMAGCEDWNCHEGWGER